MNVYGALLTLFFLSFFTRASTAFSAHFSSSSPCFQPRSFLTAGDVKENKELRLVMIVSLILLLSHYMYIKCWGSQGT